MSGRVATSILAGATPLELDPDTIDVEGRLGFYYEDKAEAFAHLLAAKGQRVPILVSAAKPGGIYAWRLHVGLHRTMGARIAGLPVYAMLVSGTADELSELEASENIERRVVEPIERAIFVFHTCEAARIRIAREHGNLKQQQLAVKARWDRVKSGDSRVEEALQSELSDTCDNLSRVYGWAETAAEALGMGKREVHRSLELYRLVIQPFPELAERLAHHPAVGNNASQLRDIAQVKSEAQRRQVIELLLADNHLNVDMARVQVGIDRPGGPAPSAELKFVNQVIGGLSRLSATSQKHHLDVIVRSLKSDEVKRQLRDRLNEELDETGESEPLVFHSKAAAQ